MTQKLPETQVAHELTMLHLSAKYSQYDPESLATQYDIVYEEIYNTLHKTTDINSL